jgi:hypothetical protein
MGPDALGPCLQVATSFAIQHTQTPKHPTLNEPTPGHRSKSQAAPAHVFAIHRWIDTIST